MRRMVTVVGVAVAFLLCVAALGAEAQQAPKVFRIGVLSLTRFIE